jgi:hypothetical protein
MTSLQALNCLRTTSASCGGHPALPMTLSLPVNRLIYFTKTDYWYHEYERSLLWFDPTVGVQWSSVGAPKLAAKDAAGKVLAEADIFA